MQTRLTNLFSFSFLSPGRMLAALLAAAACLASAAAAAQEADADSHAEESEHGGDAREVHLTEAQRGRLDIQVAAAPAGSARAVVTAPATAAFNADRLVRLGPRLPAKVVRIVKDLGEPVAAGEVVTILDSVALGKAKARYLIAKARYEAATADHDREKLLAAEKISSEAEKLEAHARFIEAEAELEAAREELRLYGLSLERIAAIEAGGNVPLSRYTLTSPRDGVLQRRDGVPGQSISPQETPFHVVDPTAMWLFIDVYEKDAAHVAPGQRVEFTARAIENRVFAGGVDWVSRALDEETRTVRVRATLSNEDGLLRDGMFGTARIQTGAEASTALLPVDAVQTLDDGPVVFVPADEPGAFRAIGVETGEEAAGRIEIRSGIAPGAPVVLSGAFDLKSALTAGGRSAAHGH